ncbi:MAG TPA: hypothetical protein VFJ93_00575 [Gaiellaceae bacterium]|nr:hypothetical protein [Gaiellaceae bacterium]
MVVHGVAIPTVSGATRDQEISPVPAAATAVPDAVRSGRSLHIVLVPMLVVSQVAWLMLLGYGALRILF